jgi:hypothetical protein
MKIRGLIRSICCRRFSYSQQLVLLCCHSFCCFFSSHSFCFQGLAELVRSFSVVHCRHLPRASIVTRSSSAALRLLPKAVQNSQARKIINAAPLPSRSTASSQHGRLFIISSGSVDCVCAPLPNNSPHSLLRPRHVLSQRTRPIFPKSKFQRSCQSALQSHQISMVVSARPRL